jgi:MOSC domain-containing protein YiiM
MAKVDSINLGCPRPNPHKTVGWTGIGKQPTDEPVQVRAPGPKTTGIGSGLIGDFIGDRKHHGGDDQAVYAFQREDLDEWERRLGRELPNGYFGENLTTIGLDVNDARIGEQWRIGQEVVLQVTAPRIPCSTFRGWMGEKGWAKTFTATGRPGAYLRVISPGAIQAGDAIEVIDRPGHEITITLLFKATTTNRELLPQLLAAEAYLDPETIEMARQRKVFLLE